MDNLFAILLENIALIGGMIGFALIVLLFQIFSGADDRKEQLTRRIARVSGEDTRPDPEKLSIRSKTKSSSSVEKTIAKLMPDAKQLEAKIEQSGLTLSLGRLGLLCIAFFAISVTAFVVVLDLPFILALTSGFTLAIGVPYLVIKKKAEHRLAKFVDSLPDALDLICRGLRAGLPVMESISTVGEELPNPIGQEFRDLQSRVQMGSSLEDGFWEMARRVPSDELRFLITAISIQRETGGNLAETLGNLSDLLRKRRAFKLKVKAMSSEARASAWIIGSLPFAMFGILSILNPGYLSVLISDPRGIAMAVFGLLMIAVGAFIMVKLVQFEA